VKDREVSVKDEDSMIVVWQSLGMMRRILYCFMVGEITFACTDFSRNSSKFSASLFMIPEGEGKNECVCEKRTTHAFKSQASVVSKIQRGFFKPRVR